MSQSADERSNQFRRQLKSVIKFLASLKLAVVVIAAVASVIAAGTIVESKYDAIAAKKWVYDTFWVYTVMTVLAVNLIAVMVDRWPWKKRHTPFVLAHIGILVLMTGAILTQKYGLDGSVRVGIGQSNQFVTVGDTDVLVYTSFDGDRYTKLAEEPVDFFLHPPTKEKPMVIPGYNAEVKFTEYKPYVIPSRKVVAPKDANKGRWGAGLRFQVQNPNIKVNVIEWLVQRRPKDLATHNFGPAALHLGPAPAKGQGMNEIYFTPNNQGSVNYVVFQKDSEKPIKSGAVNEGDSFMPGWKMPIEVRVLRYLPEATEEWELQDRETPTPLTTSAVKMEFGGEEHWLLLNDTVKLFTDNAVYIVSYGNRRIDMGFSIKLKNFEIDRYQGTNRAMAYKSNVEVPNVPSYEISMNEPLKYRGLTIYQASFEQDPGNGEPVASVFSVNQDPGRWVKYLGSLIMVIGIIMLFYFKEKAVKKDSQE